MAAARLLLPLLLMLHASVSLAGELPSVAVLPPLLRGVGNPTPVELYGNRTIAALQDSAVFSRVMSPQQVEALLGRDASRGLVQCANDECSVVDSDLLGSVSTSYVVIPRSSVFGKSVLLKIKLVDVRRALEVGSSARRVETVDPASLESAVSAMVAEVLVQASLKAAAAEPTKSAAAPANAVAPPAVEGTTPAVAQTPSPAAAPAGEEPSSPLVPVVVGAGVGVAVVVVSLVLVAAVGAVAGIAVALTVLRR